MAAGLVVASSAARLLPALCGAGRARGVRRRQAVGVAAAAAGALHACAALAFATAALVVVHLVRCGRPCAQQPDPRECTALAHTLVAVLGGSAALYAALAAASCAVAAHAHGVRRAAAQRDGSKKPRLRDGFA